MISNPTYIEQQLSFYVSEFEGLWEMTFRDPFSRENNVSIYVAAPNSDYDNTTSEQDKPIVKAGPRLSDFLNHLLYKIEYYPYTWDLAGKKLVTYGYDFETDYNGSNISEIDLTEIAFKEVNEYYNFFSPLETNVVNVSDKVSGKGVMVKLEITLDKPKNVNHLEIDFFTEYPIELLSLMYKVDQKDTAATYEIPLSKVVQTSGSIYLHFSSVFAKVFYLIIKQEAYTLIDKVKTKEESANEKLWEQATVQSQQIYESSVSDYMSELFATQSAIQLHQDILDSYKTVNRKIEEPSMDPLNEYRSDFNNVKSILDSEQR